jgi:hypothetical protein
MKVARLLNISKFTYEYEKSVGCGPVLKSYRTLDNNAAIINTRCSNVREAYRHSLTGLLPSQSGPQHQIASRCMNNEHTALTTPPLHLKKQLLTWFSITDSFTRY